MTDQPTGLVLRVVERIQTKQPDTGPAPVVVVPFPNPPELRRAAIDPAPPTVAAATSAPRDFPASHGESHSFTLASAILWASFALACIAFFAGVFLVLPSAQRNTVAAAPSAQVEAASGTATNPAPAAPQGDDLVDLGSNVLSSGDIATARLYFERAAEMGNPRAARLAGKTYDPAFLASLGVHGMRGDPASAARWYQRARDLGDPDAPAAPSSK